MRQLLALIALLTGFAALVEPVHAAETGIESVRLVQGEAAQAQAAQVAVALATRPRAERPERIAMPLPRVAVVLPAIVLKADRALE